MREERGAVTHRNLQGKFLGSLWSGFPICEVGDSINLQGILRRARACVCNWDKHVNSNAFACKKSRESKGG